MKRISVTIKELEEIIQLKKSLMPNMNLSETFFIEVSSTNGIDSKLNVVFPLSLVNYDAELSITISGVEKW